MTVTKTTFNAIFNYLSKVRFFYLGRATTAGYLDSFKSIRLRKGPISLPMDVQEVCVCAFTT